MNDVKTCIKNKSINAKLGFLANQSSYHMYFSGKAFVCVETDCPAAQSDLGIDESCGRL